MIEVNKKYGCLTVLEIVEEKKESETRYKCQCKCGKIHYYTMKTIESKPRYCYYPIPISTRHTYDVSAVNATYRKQLKYNGIENVILLDKSECGPSEKYCDYYNKYKSKQIAKKTKDIPRNYAENYDVDYVGFHFETLYVEECINEHFESTPTYTTFNRHKYWNPITIYKRYKCRCLLCGKFHNVNCDQFVVLPPKLHGRFSHNGYIGKFYCDCHPISSFQWIVNKLLLDNHVPYRAEYSFYDLSGIYGRQKLRFDFAILNEDESVKYLIECQGEQHYEPVEKYGGKETFKILQVNDKRKREYAKSHNIPLLEIKYEDNEYDRIKTILEKWQII